jgi:hypothetical protein
MTGLDKISHFEFHLCGELHVKDKKIIERIEESGFKFYRKFFYSIYAIDHEGISLCIADIPDKRDAKQICTTLNELNSELKKVKTP